MQRKPNFEITEQLAPDLVMDRSLQVHSFVVEKGYWWARRDSMKGNILSLAMLFDPTGLAAAVVCGVARSSSCRVLGYDGSPRRCTCAHYLKE